MGIVQNNNNYKNGKCHKGRVYNVTLQFYNFELGNNPEKLA